MNDRGYLAPKPFGEDLTDICTPDEISAWCDGVISDAKSFLRLQPAYPFIQDGLDIVNGIWSQTTQVPALSNLKTDSTLRNLKEIVAAQTNIRIIPAFKTEIGEFRAQNQILNKDFMNWQVRTFADRQLRKGWQFACAAGTGYGGVRYDPNFYYKGKGDIVIDAYGPMDVLPIGLPRSHDLQKAYAVALRVETPLHEAWRLFPDAADLIRPMRQGGEARGTVMAQSVRFASAVLKRYGQGRKYEHELTPFDMVDIYYIYIDDDSVNDTGHEILMRGPDGKYGTSWCYKVPYLGQEIQLGKDRYRKATKIDALLYPNRRLIVYIDGIPVNPDPQMQASPYWHGKVPVFQLRADDWAWNYLGFPLTRYGQSLEKAMIEFGRGMVDASNVRMNMPLGHDRGTTATSLMQTFNPRLPGQRLGLDPTLAAGKDQVFPIVPPAWYDVPPHVVESFFKGLPGMIKDQMGVADASALARARQLPAGDSVEKIMEALGPIPKDQSRNMESSICHFGELWKSNYFQFIQPAARLQRLGPEGLAEEDTDYEPGTLIPMTEDIFKMSDQYKEDQRELLRIPEAWQRGNEVSKFERARWHKDNFSFTVTPYSLHEFNSTTRKLFFMQLKKTGFPLDPWTEAELFDMKNFGAPPRYRDPDTGEEREAQTILERWICWMEMQARMAQAGGQPQGKGKQKGRPSTGATAPVLEQKSGGTDSTVRESRHAQ
jgi:hypothetical protein